MNEERYEDERGATRARGAFWSIAALLVLCPLLMVGFGLSLYLRPASKKLLAAEAQSTPTPLPLFSEPLLVALDKAVQKRFATLPVAGGFGMNRLVQFEPVTPDEKNALLALEKSPSQVVFYTAGRTRQMNPRNGVVVPTGAPIIGMRGPVRLGIDTQVVKGNHGNYVSGEKFPLVSGRLASSDAPTALAVKQHLTGSLDEVRVEPQHWKSGRWELVAVPVPASAPACVTCHNLRLNPRGTKTEFPALKLGDTIGLAVYAYAPKDKAGK